MINKIKQKKDISNMHPMRQLANFLILSLLMGLVPILTAQSTISRDIHIPKGIRSQKNISTISGDVVIGYGAVLQSDISVVSGDVQVGARAEVGHVKTVSGDISIGKQARTHKLESVSGDIRLYPRSDVLGSVKTVSGDLIAETGTDIRENIVTVSGDIELDDSSLHGYIRTVSGDISLFNGATVKSDIFIDRKADHTAMIHGHLKVIIDMNSVVEGDIIVKEPGTNVIVYLRKGGRVIGEIVNAEVIKK